MIETKSFHSHLEEGVLTLTLDRPGRINALTFEVYGELRDTFRHLKENEPEVRAIVLTGSGPRGFCSGGDVNDIIARLFDLDMAGLVEFTRMTGALVHAIRTTRPPVIAALHGVCCGAGAVIAAASDVRFATPNLRMAYLFPQVGLSGADMGAAYLLPRIVGLGRATEILLSGRFVHAPEAERIGLVQRIIEAPTGAVEAALTTIPSGESSDADQNKARKYAEADAHRKAMLAEAHQFARSLAEGPAFAHAMTKKMLEYEGHCDFTTAIEAEAQAQAICMAHPDFREAHEAYKAKRKPRFA